MMDDELHDRLRNIRTGKIRINTKELKRFYVGSPSMVNGSNPNWARKTLAEAVQHARELAEESGHDQFVVKVVRVVRHPRPRLIVEEVG
jgi:hypothetical protein